MSTTSDRPVAQQTPGEIRAAKHGLGHRGWVDDVVGARDARLDALDVHGSLIRVLGGHVDAASLGAVRGLPTPARPPACAAVAADIGSPKLSACAFATAAGR